MNNDQNMIIVNLRRRALERRKDTHLRYDFEDARRTERALAVEQRWGHRINHTMRRVADYRTRCVLCGLGHRLVSWGRYLEERFALPEVTVPQQEGTPPVATANHG